MSAVPMRLSIEVPRWACGQGSARHAGCRRIRTLSGKRNQPGLAWETSKLPFGSTECGPKDIYPSSPGLVGALLDMETGTRPLAKGADPEVEISPGDPCCLGNHRSPYGGAAFPPEPEKATSIEEEIGRDRTGGLPAL